MLNSVDILGVSVHSGQTPDVIAHIDHRLRRKATTRVAFLNAHLSNVCARRGDLRADMRHFLVLNDGVGVDIARRILHGSWFDENLNGTDFVPAFLEATALDLKIFLLGASEDVVQRTGKTIGRRWPRHRIVGLHHGFLTEADEEPLRQAIVAARPI